MENIDKFRKAAMENDIGCLRDLLSTYPDLLYSRDVRDIWLLKMKQSEDKFWKAAKENDIEGVRKLLSLYPELLKLLYVDTLLFAPICAQGFLEIAKFLYENFPAVHTFQAI